MNDLPLHPAVVHLPLALALVVPALAAWHALRVAWRRDARAAFGVVVALQLAMAASALVALQTGEREEHVVAEVTGDAAIGEHEEAADAFFAAAVANLLVGAVALVARREADARRAIVVFAAGSVAVAALAIRTGRRGGELVYRHGAARAYAAPSASGKAP